MYLTANHTFSQLYASTIAPLLRRAAGQPEKIRPRARTWAVTACALACVLACVLTGGLILGGVVFLAPDIQTALFLLGFAAFSTLILCGVMMREPHRAIDARLAEHTGEILAGHACDGTYVQTAPLDWLPLKRMAEIGVIGWGGSCHMGAGLEGGWQGKRFRFASVHKTRKISGDTDSDDRRVVFSGLVMRTDWHRSMPLIVIRPRTLIGDHASVRTHVSQMPQWILGHDGFDARFELWSRSGTIARQALGPEFGDCFLRFADAFARGGAHAGHVAAVFDGMTLLLAVERHETFLDLDSHGLDETAFQDKCADVIDEMRLPCRMIDTLTGAA